MNINKNKINKNPEMYISTGHFKIEGENVLPDLMYTELIKMTSNYLNRNEIALLF